MSLFKPPPIPLFNPPLHLRPPAFITSLWLLVWIPFLKKRDVGVSKHGTCGLNTTLNVAKKKDNMRDYVSCWFALLFFFLFLVCWNNEIVDTVCALFVQLWLFHTDTWKMGQFWQIFKNCENAQHGGGGTTPREKNKNKIRTNVFFH